MDVCEPLTYLDLDLDIPPSSSVLIKLLAKQDIALCINPNIAVGALEFAILIKKVHYFVRLNA